MPAMQDARDRTRALARVIGPFLVIIPISVAIRAPELGLVLTAFFRNEALVWITGGVLLFGGLIIIAYHDSWSTLAAIVISLFGWLLALRGTLLLVAPHLMARASTAAVTVTPLVMIGFGLLMLVGLWLTYVGWIARPPAP
jgi:hypothetical protein